jgi:hypothetical protein
MAVMRVEKNSNYTIMANYHLRDTRLSLKAKGLLSVMLSLPPEWDFTLAGLARISKEGISAIRAAVVELEETGYVVRVRVRNEAGQLTETEYTIYEFPQNVEQDDSGEEPRPTDHPGTNGSMLPHESPVCSSPALEKPTSENPTLDNPTLGNPTLENRTQLNTDRSKTDQKKKEKSNTDTSNPHQSSTYPSILETTEQHEEDARHQELSQPMNAVSPAMITQAQTSSLVHLGQPEGLTVQQMYMTEETSIPGMRRRLSYEAFIRKVKRQIDYWDLMDGNDKDEIENILSIMVEVLSAQCESFTISGRKYPADLVHQRFSEISSSHIEYVLECFHKCGSDIRNIKQYLIAALFNAPATYSSYYGAAVRRDIEWLRR